MPLVMPLALSIENLLISLPFQVISHQCGHSLCAVTLAPHTASAVDDIPKLAYLMYRKFFIFHLSYLKHKFLALRIWKRIIHRPGPSDPRNDISLAWETPRPQV